MLRHSKVGSPMSASGHTRTLDRRQWADFRFGSKVDMAPVKRDVRFPPRKRTLPFMFDLQLTPAIYEVDNSDTAEPVSDFATSRARFSFISYLSALNSFKRERATSFTDSTANGRIL